MRVRSFVLGASTVLLLSAMALPVKAACGAGYGGFYGGEINPIYSNPDWPRGGSFCTGCGPALSGEHDGVFWHFGYGDPVPGIGNDSGAWPATEWLQPFIPDSGPYYFRGTLDYFGGWHGDPSIDGCILDTDPEGCTCIALADHYPGENLGRFASMSARIPPFIGRFDFSPGGLPGFPLVPMPTPIVESSQEFGDGSVDVTVRVDPPSDGNYVGFNGCDCAAVGYLIRAVENPDGVATIDDPGTRAKSAWELLPLGDGRGNDAGPQLVTVLGESVTVHAACSGVNPVDLYLATELFFPNGDGPLFTVEYVSGDSAVVECGVGDGVPATDERGWIALIAILMTVSAVLFRQRQRNP